MIIATKNDFYYRFLRGDFGNRAEQWMDVGEFAKSGFTSPVGIRSLKPGELFLSHVPAAKVTDTVKQHWPRGGYNISPMMPDEHILIQGELCECPTLELFYSHAKVPMRAALKQSPQHASGLRARIILQHFLDPPSYGDLESLLDLYPGAALEFSTYAINVGVLKRNTIVWEVRNY